MLALARSLAHCLELVNSLLGLDCCLRQPPVGEPRLRHCNTASPPTDRQYPLFVPPFPLCPVPYYRFKTPRDSRRVRRLSALSPSDRQCQYNTRTNIRAPLLWIRTADAEFTLPCQQQSRPLIASGRAAGLCGVCARMLRRAALEHHCLDWSLECVRVSTSAMFSTIASRQEKHAEMVRAVR